MHKKTLETVKKTGFFRKHYILLLSFIIPVVLLELAYLTRGIFPVGKYGLLIIDLYHQYAPFLSELQEKIRHLGSPLFSWRGGLGTSFIPLYSYYLASPLNVIMAVFPKSLLTEAVLVLTLMKVGLAGCFFSIYLKGVYKKRDMAIIAFSVLYALSGYMLSYSWNIMWLDVLYMLPLIILGLTRLVRGKGGVLYAVTLGIALISNFYMAYFLCLFILLYYPLCYFKNNGLKPFKRFVRISLKFGGYSLLAGGIASFLLLPTYFALQLTSAAGDSMPRTLKHTYDIFDYVSRHFIGAMPTFRDGMPNLYAGIIVLILVPIYFLSKRIKLKDKILDISLIFFLFLSLNLNILNFIWHGFHYPNQLPYRNSFLYIFVILTISYPAFNKVKEFSGKFIGGICSVIIIIIILTQKLNETPPAPYVLYISIAFIIAYGAALTINKAKKMKVSRMVLIFCIVVVIEAAASSALTIGKIDEVESYAGRPGYSTGPETAEIRKVIADIEEKEEGFFRMEIVPPKTTNDPFLYNFNGLSLFSSTFTEQPVKTFKKIGYHSNNINSYKYEGSTIIADSLFGLEYIINRSRKIDEKIYESYYSSDEIDVYRNPYALSIGFWGPEKIENWTPNWSNAVNTQNDLLKVLSGGEKDVLLPIKHELGDQISLKLETSGSHAYSYEKNSPNSTATASIKLNIKKSGNVYMYLDVTTGSISSGHVMIGENRINFNPSRSTFIYMGYVEEGTDPIVNFEIKKDKKETGRITVYPVALDLEAFENSIGKIAENSMTIEKVTDTYIRAHASAPDDGMMVITTPYNRGWSIKVDGVNVESKSINDWLLSFEIEKGTHEIELRFMPYMFLPGLGLSILSLIIIASILYIEKRRKGRTV